LLATVARAYYSGTVFLRRIEILTKMINHTNKETGLKAPHPVIYGGVLNNLSQIFGDTWVTPNGQK
jgi:hypothetical protein